MPSNILLVIMDSARAKNMSVYGHRNHTTPFLEKFVDMATIYQHAQAPSIHSIASHVSIFTGLHVNEHCCTEHESQIKPTHTIWRTLEEDFNYSTGLFTPNTVVASASNLDECFETSITSSVEYSDRSSSNERLFNSAFDPKDVAVSEGVVKNIKRSLDNQQPVRSLLNCVHRSYLDRKERGATANLKQSADIYVDEFTEWHKKQSQPWAACLNLMDPHYPYLPDNKFNRWGDSELISIGNTVFGQGPLSKTVLAKESWWKLKALEALYDGGIYQTDQAIKQLITLLKKRNDFKNTLIVITSDHGEGFGEQSCLEPSVRMVDHSWGIHEVLTHVPLIVKYPEQHKNCQVDKLATLTQFPTAAKLAATDANAHDPFVPDEEPVISSTYRLLERDTCQFPNRDMSDHVGPWLASYEKRGGRVHKYVKHGEKTATIAIQDAQNAWVVTDSVPDDAFTIFEMMDKIDIRQSDTGKSVSDSVDSRLENLGYLR